MDKSSNTRSGAGEWGHILWRSPLQNNISLTHSLHFPKVTAWPFCPLVTLWSFQSVLTLPRCQLLHRNVIFHLQSILPLCLHDNEHMPALLQVFLDMIPPCILYCLTSAQQECHCPSDTRNSLPVSEGLVSLVPHVLQNKIRPSGWRSPLGVPGWEGTGLQGSRSFMSVQNTRLTNLTEKAYVSKWW